MNLSVNRENFEDFVEGYWDYDYDKQEHTVFWLKPKDMDVSGGHMTIEELRTLDDLPELDVIQISGLDQKTFEYFITNYGKQFRVIRFFKNKKVKDWSLLGTLTQIEAIYYFFNQYIDHFWDMSKNVNLKYLAINDFSKLYSLKGVETAPNLICFYIGNAVWVKGKVDSIKWFAHTNIETLQIGKPIDDENLSYVEDMPNLKDIPNVYGCTLEQFAWLAAHCPDKMKNLLPYYEYEGYSSKDEYYLRVQLVGANRSFKKTTKNEKRIQEHMERFEALKAYYIDKPYPLAKKRGVTESEISII